MPKLPASVTAKLNTDNSNITMVALIFGLSIIILALVGVDINALVPETVRAWKCETVVTTTVETVSAPEAPPVAPVAPTPDGSEKEHTEPALAIPVE